MGYRKEAALAAVAAVTTGVAAYACGRIASGPITPEQDPERDARLFNGGYMLALAHVRRGLLTQDTPHTE